MFRFALLAVVLVPPATGGSRPPLAAADEAKGEKVEYTAYPDYFEKNNSGFKGEKSFLAFPVKEGFDKVFALRPPLMGGKKPGALPETAFEKKLVFAVITRGPAVTRYTVEKVTRDGDTIYVQYKAQMDKPGTATFASPLVIAADRGKVMRVVFIENGKTVGTAEVK
jgi:hypothetical protein